MVKRTRLECGKAWVWHSLVHKQARSRRCANLDSEVQSSVALCRDHEAGCKLGHHVLGPISHQQVGKDMVHEQSSGYAGSVTLNILHDATTHQAAGGPVGEDRRNGEGGEGGGRGVVIECPDATSLAAMHAVDDLLCGRRPQGGRAGPGGGATDGPHATSLSVSHELKA